MTFGERLTQLRRENGYSTRNEFADKLGIPGTTLRNYETNVREPGHTFLKQISELFNVSVDYLLCLTDEKEVLNTFRLRSSEQAMIEAYRKLDPHGQETVYYILKRETERVTALRDKDSQIAKLEATEQRSPVRLINYYYRLASAGTGQIVFDMPPTRTIEIPDIPEYKKANYAIGVNGISMEPVYHDGDILLVEMTDHVEIGEIGIFLVDGQSYVKQRGQDELISLNKCSENVPLTSDSRCMGRVIARLEP